MNEKVKEIKRAEKLKKSKLLHGVGTTSLSNATSISSSNVGQLTSAVVRDSFVLSVPKPTAVTHVGGGKALKLGSKATTDDMFLQQLRNEGQEVANSVAKVCICLF